MKQILKEILCLNENIQTAGVINTQEYTFTSFRNKKTHLSEMEEDNFTLQQLQIAGMQKIYDKNFGKIKSYFVFHEKTNLLFFYITKYIFFIICNKKYKRNDLLDLIDQFEKILANSTNPELFKTKYAKQMCESCSRVKCLKGCWCPCHDKFVQKLVLDLDYL